MKALSQFRKEESELFNSETGEYYTGTWISPRQCEMMRDSINELEASHKELIKIINSFVIWDNENIEFHNINPVALDSIHAKLKQLNQ